MYRPKETAVALDFATVYVDANANDPETSSLLKCEVRETSTMDAIGKYVTPGSTVLDVGANYGVYAIRAAQLVGPAGMVYAFEPNPILAHLLSKSKRANDLSCLRVVNSVVGERRGPVGFRLMEGVHGSGQVHELGENQMQMIALDDILVTEVSLLKIDVEGYEGQVLMGGDVTIRRNRPVIVVELHDIALKPMIWFERYFDEREYELNQVHDQDHIAIPRERI